MTSEEWIESFTGLTLATGKPDPNNPALDQDALFEKEMLTKQALLGSVMSTLTPLKPKIQKAMESKVSTGKLRKEGMLKIKGTSVDEAEFEEIDISSISDLPTEVQLALAEANTAITNGSGRLKDATFKRYDKEGKLVDGPLFTNQELEDGYWFPLTRERILPETFIADLFSKTQKMLNATNEAYLGGVEQRKEAGQLTAKPNLKTVLDIGSDIVSVAGGLTEAVNGGKAGVELALKILDGVQIAMTTGGQVYEKLAQKEFGDATQVGLDGVSALCGIFFKGVIPEETIKIVQGSLKMGGMAAKAGQKLAAGTPEGVSAGMDLVSEVFKSALLLAADDKGCSEEQKKALTIAATAGSGALKLAGKGPNLVKAIKARDLGGVSQFVTDATVVSLQTVQTVRLVEGTSGKSKEETTKIKDQLAQETRIIEGVVVVVGATAQVTIEVVFAVRQGTYLQALNKVVESIGTGLGGALAAAGVDAKQAKQIGAIYGMVTTGAGVLVCLAKEDPDVAGALAVLGKGFADAMAKAAPENKGLVQAGKEMGAALVAIAGSIKIHKLIKEEKYSEAMALFNSTVLAEVKGMLASSGLEEDEEEGEDKEEEEEDEEEKPEEDGGLTEEESEQVENAKANFLKGIKSLGEKVKAAGPEVANGLKAVEKAETEKEVEEILAEAEEDVKAIAELSEAEKLGLEASNIDALIAKVMRDQMITKVAVQLMSGGAAFAASFVPALGMVAAGVKLAANMVAAGQRAVQLAKWVDNQRDFAAAQNALTSSSQNFVKNQSEQFAHYTIQACFEGAKLIGGALELGGITAAAGTGTKMAAELGSKLENIFQKIYGVVKLERAWKLTKSSILNPTNRKLGLKARAQNATLAKYSIAWGAVVKKDALAQKALAACDLTQAVLESENANVDKVVTYLETFYEDDEKLYREVVAAKWMPPTITLTLRSWTKLKQLAVANIKLSNPKTDALDGQLALLKTPLAKLDEKGLEARIALLKDITASFKSYTPATPTKDAEKPLVAAIKMLTGQAKDAEAAAVAALAAHRKAATEKTAEIQRAAEERAKLLTDKAKVLEALDIHIDAIKYFDDVTELPEMEETKADLEKLVSDVIGTKALKNDGDVAKRLSAVALAQRKLQRLMTAAELAQV